MRIFFWKKEKTPRGKKFWQEYIWFALGSHLLGGVGIGMLTYNLNLIPPRLIGIAGSIPLGILILAYFNAYVGGDEGIE